MFAVLLSMVSIVSVSANNVWTTFGLYPWVNFKVTNSGIHIASDPLFLSSDIPSITPFDPASGTTYLKGWVTFPCATDRADQKNAPKGFEYSIRIAGIAPGVYTIKAYPVSGSSDYGIVPSYTLRTFTAGASEEVEVSGFYDLAGPAGYDWAITVEMGGSAIYQTHPADVAGFFVIS